MLKTTRTRQPDERNSRFPLSYTLCPPKSYTCSVFVFFFPAASTSSFVTVSDPTGTGAVLTAILAGGAISGVNVVNGGFNYTSPTVAIADSGGGTGTGATAGTPVLATPSYPSCNTYFQQRQIFGGLSQSVDGLVMSRTGDFRNMTYSTPSRDDDMVQVTIASTTVNPIKHLVPLTSLVVLTGAGAWRVDGGSQSDAITATHINAVPQAYNGCSDVPPLVINYDILYVQAKGSTVRDLAYNFYVNLYTGTDISMLANHLFFGHQILEWAWAEEPFKLVWAVRDDGVALSLTIMKEQEIYGWARHDTCGQYISVDSVLEGEENVATDAHRLPRSFECLAKLVRDLRRHEELGVGGLGEGREERVAACVIEDHHAFAQFRDLRDAVDAVERLREEGETFGACHRRSSSRSSTPRSSRSAKSVSTRCIRTSLRAFYPEKLRVTVGACKTSRTTSSAPSASPRTRSSSAPPRTRRSPT